MRSKVVQTWMSNEMERLSTRLERYKPSGSGYNRIKPIVLSKSVTHMLNNPLPVEDQIARQRTSNIPANAVTGAVTGATSKNQQRESRMHGILSCSNSEWEEVYPTVKFSQNNCREEDSNEAPKSFVFYRSCSTRII